MGLIFLWFGLAGPQIVRYGLILEWQYSFKNLVIIGAGMVLGANVRGGRLISEKVI